MNPLLRILSSSINDHIDIDAPDELKGEQGQPPTNTQIILIASIAVGIIFCMCACVFCGDWIRCIKGCCKRICAKKKKEIKEVEIKSEHSDREGKERVEKGRFLTLPFDLHDPTKLTPQQIRDTLTAQRSKVKISDKTEVQSLSGSVRSEDVNEKGPIIPESYKGNVVNVITYSQLKKTFEYIQLPESESAYIRLKQVAKEFESFSKEPSKPNNSNPAASPLSTSNDIILTSHKDCIYALHLPHYAIDFSAAIFVSNSPKCGATCFLLKDKETLEMVKNVYGWMEEPLEPVKPKPRGLDGEEKNENTDATAAVSSTVEDHDGHADGTNLKESSENDNQIHHVKDSDSNLKELLDQYTQSLQLYQQSLEKYNKLPIHGYSILRLVDVEIPQHLKEESANNIRMASPTHGVAPTNSDDEFFGPPPPSGEEQSENIVPKKNKLLFKSAVKASQFTNRLMKEKEVNRKKDEVEYGIQIAINIVSGNGNDSGESNEGASVDNQVELDIDDFLDVDENSKMEV